jgi:hypothetical protein
MAVQFFDLRIFGAYVVDAWQQHFNTEMDPADGQWFTNGPGNNGGLYGKLTDTLASELEFDASKQIFSPNKVAAATGIADNRNGLTPEQTVTLTYAYQDSASSTHATTQGLKIATGTDIKASFFGQEATYKFSTEYSYSWTDSNTTQKTETKTFQQQIPVRNIPKGKVYQVVLMVDKNQLRVPYHANIYISGTSSACFRNPVNGEKIWTVDAGTLCEWINQFGSAGDQSYTYGRDPNKPAQGICFLQGNLTATETANFLARTFDITDLFTGSQPPSLETVLARQEIGSVPLSG